MVHLLADKGVETGAHGFSHQKGVDGLPSRRKFVDDGQVQIAVENQRQCPGDGRCRHDQQVGAAGLGRQGGPLAHAEAVLLVGNDQIQTVERHIAGEQGVGADDHLGRTICNGGFGGPLGGGAQGTGQQYGGDAQGFKQRL